MKTGAIRQAFLVLMLSVAGCKRVSCEDACDRIAQCIDEDQAARQLDAGTTGEPIKSLDRSSCLAECSAEMGNDQKAQEARAECILHKSCTEVLAGACGRPEQ